MLGLLVDYNRIRLPAPYADADLVLLNPSLEVSFSRRLFWTNQLQYNNQQNTLALNSRLQWRFAPLSDLFIVYNDNQAVNPFSTRFRAVNVKLTYWLDL